MFGALCGFAVSCIGLLVVWDSLLFTARLQGLYWWLLVVIVLCGLWYGFAINSVGQKASFVGLGGLVWLLVT